MSSPNGTTIFPIQWLNDERTILQVTLPASFTWDEQNKSVREVAETIRTVDHTVHLVVNTVGAKMPKGNPFPHLRYFVMSMPDNLGVTITVGAGRVERTIVGAFLRIAHRFGAKETYIVETMDEAMAILTGK